MGFSTPVALRSLDLFGIIHTHLFGLRLHTNAWTTNPTRLYCRLAGSSWCLWGAPRGVFLVVFWAVLAPKWCRGLCSQPGTGRGRSGAVALPWQDAVLHRPRRGIAAGETNDELHRFSGLFVFFSPLRKWERRLLEAAAATSVFLAL